MLDSSGGPKTSPDFVHLYFPGRSGRILLLLHGTGGDEKSMLPLAKTIDGDAAVVAVRGKVLENGMPRFFRRFAEGVFDIEDIKYRTNELADFLKGASRKYGFPLGSLTALGYSNGANIGAALLLLRPEALGKAILLRPTLPLEPDEAPELSGRTVFISAGTRDDMTPRVKTEQLERLLRAAGADVTVNWEDSGHGITRDELGRVRSWLAGTPKA